MFTYYLHPTYELVRELLSQGPEVEVLAPEELRHEVHRWANNIAAHYQTDQPQ